MATQWRSFAVYKATSSAIRFCIYLCGFMALFWLVSRVCWPLSDERLAWKHCCQDSLIVLLVLRGFKETLIVTISRLGTLASFLTSGLLYGSPWQTPQMSNGNPELELVKYCEVLVLDAKRTQKPSMTNKAVSTAALQRITVKAGMAARAVMTFFFMGMTFFLHISLHCLITHKLFTRGGWNRRTRARYKVLIQRRPETLLSSRTVI